MKKSSNKLLSIRKYANVIVSWCRAQTVDSGILNLIMLNNSHRSNAVPTTILIEKKSIEKLNH